MVDEAEPVWSQLPPCSFVVDFDRVLFVAWDRYEIQEGLRVVERAIPYVDGEQLDETGLTAERFTIAIPFFNDIPDMDGMLGLTPIMYPDRMNHLIELFRRKKTGTLNMMTRRNIRCKALEWTRSGHVDQRDGEVLTVVFKVDNEAKLDGPSAENLSVKVNLQRKVEEAEFEAEREGTWDGSWEDITEFAAQLDAAMSAPSEFRDDIRQKAHRVVAACDRVLESHQRNDPGRDGFNDPSSEPARRSLEEVRDMAARADGETREQRPRVVTRTYDRDYSIWEIAVLVNQDSGRLLYLNDNLEDPNWIPAGTPVLIEAA